MTDTMCSREKYWKEKTADEKIETLREEVKILGRTVSELFAIVEQLKKHGHMSNGQLSVPLSNDSGEPTAGYRSYRYGNGEDRPF